MKRFVCVGLVAAALIGQVSSTVSAVVAPSTLSFFRNFFITGDVVTEGVGLRTARVGDVARGTIAIDRIPANVDIAAAFLYWQVVSPEATPAAGALGVRFRGHRLSQVTGNEEEPFGLQVGTGAAACWASGGAGPDRTFTFRADVLRYLDIDEDTGRLTANGSHAIEVPSRPGVLPLGASLVVVYRDPTRPLSGIVIYDGAATLGPASPALAFVLGGFYDAATDATITAIAGGARADRTDSFTYNGLALPGMSFSAAAGPNWDTPTAAVVADPARRDVNVGLRAPDGDCLTVGALVYRTEVKDADGDGLLDLWESSPTPLRAPDGRTLPHFSAMGAYPDRKDLFVEIGYMHTPVPTTYGADVRPPHSHLPSHEALKAVGDMFANAEGGAIQVHFDVGPDYPTGEADPYIIRGAGLARGGEAIDEATTVCTPQPGDAPWVCQFSAHPGTVGWKTGFRLLRDEVLAGPPTLPDGTDPCDLPGNACERRFDANRLQSFHYVLFAHALGLPRSEKPCLDADGTAVDAVNDRCAVASNPDFHTPKTYTGVGDFPGGDAIVSLGAFADAAGLPIGTPFMQASTLAHELGHNGERRHGGDALEPNCKPGYLSVMNYLYQLRGLLDDEGQPHLGFSGQLAMPPIDETALVDGGTTGLRYRLGWYAPLATSYLQGRAPAARTHCDGSPIAPGEAPMVRIDARAAADPLDWNADGSLTQTTFAQDVNFNGRVNGGLTPPLGSADDWATLRLDQVASRRNVGALYELEGTSRFAVGPLSLSVGKGDLGKGDLGKGDLGKGDLGKGDLGKGDLGKGDLGKGDLGKGDLGKGDLGGGDLFGNDPNNPEGELDFEIASGLARTPPNVFAACVQGIAGCASPGASLHDVVATWQAPNVGGVGSFTVYRVEGPALTPGLPWAVVASVPSVPGQEAYAAIDTTTLDAGAPYTYFVVAAYVDGVQSDPSNLVTILGPDAPANQPPGPFDIADVTIEQDTVAGPLAFTIVDEDPASVLLTASVSSTSLPPGTRVVFGGAGAHRTVTVTPPPGATGFGTVTVVATDREGASTRDGFRVTVVPRGGALYTFVNVKNAPAGPNKQFKAGSTVAMQWQYAQGGAVVDSRALTFAVTVAGPAPAVTLRNTDAGQSQFRYKASSGTWVFNLQTREADGTVLPAGEYDVTIRPSDVRYAATRFTVRVKP